MDNLKKRMKQTVNNIMKIIKTEMIRSGCKKNWFQNSYTCKDKDTDIIIAHDSKLINISEEYARLVASVSNLDSTWYSKLTESTNKYDAILEDLNTYTGNNLNNDAYNKINKYKNENSDIIIQRDLTIEFIQPLQKFLEILQNYIKEQEKKAFNEHISLEEKKREQIEKEEKERQAKEEINQIDNEVQSIQTNNIIKVEEDINKIVESTKDLSEDAINSEIKNANSQNRKNANQNATANGQNATANGQNATANGQNATANGQNATANGQNRNVNGVNQKINVAK
jgi:hypothetical protein